MFTPPRCPYLDCPYHRDPPAQFFRRRGSYRARCRAQAIPRFDCKHCRRRFSRQTFRADYRDHRPDFNARVMMAFASGIGLRQTGRMLGTRYRTIVRKFRKYGRHLERFHRNRLRTLELKDPKFLLDELETFETCRVTRPLTVPVVIHRESMFVMSTSCDTLPPRGRPKPRDSRRIESDLARFGRRRNRSRRCVTVCLEQAARVTRGTARLICDQKRTYPGIARQAFTAVVVETHPGKARRDVHNPLFRINLTAAVLRDLTSRLRRRSWLVSKKRRFLRRCALAIFTAYRNYVRPRFNRDVKDGTWKTPAQFVGAAPRPLSFERMLGWRQDWRARSPDPLAA